jgi:hypothetical protein
MTVSTHPWYRIHLPLQPILSTCGSDDADELTSHYIMELLVLASSCVCFNRAVTAWGKQQIQNKTSSQSPNFELTIHPQA